MLPAKIDGPLFTRTVERICDAINTKLEAWGVKTETNGKSFYSCRHRVPQRFRVEGMKDEEAARAISGTTAPSSSRTTPTAATGATATAMRSGS